MWFRKDDVPLQPKVDINPSYEWAPRAVELGVSHRELEVLALVVEGHKNKEIAAILGIQHLSVKNHLQHLFKKLVAKNNTQAFVMALRLDLVRMRVPFPGSGDRGTEHAQQCDLAPASR